MRVTLVHNPKAGEGVSGDEIRRLVEAAGHRVGAMLEPHEEQLARVDRGTELLVVAGGDGTVLKSAVALAGWRVPLAILPLGIANNIATSLGIEGPPDRLVAEWPRARPRPVDLGVAEGPWGERRFLESVGAGFVAAGIAAAEDDGPATNGRREVLERALQRFGEVLAELVPRHCALTLDGAAQDAEILMLEILNIRSVGPGLELAPRADAGDGRFEVVVAAAEHRPALEHYLAERRAGRRPTLRLPTRRAAAVTFRCGGLIHVGDWIHTEIGGTRVTVRNEQAAIRVLVSQAGG